MIGIVAIVVTVSVAMWPIRPIVDYTIYDESNQSPTSLDFTGGPMRLFFEVRNRGASDAPVQVNVTIMGGYLSTHADGPFNYSSTQFYSVLTAHSDNYGAWIYYVRPAQNAPSISVVFQVTKGWRLDISGISNYFFGEYNGWSTDLTFIQKKPGVYSLGTVP